MSPLIKCYSECRYAECRYAQYREAECRYAKCHGAVKVLPILPENDLAAQQLLNIMCIKSRRQNVVRPNVSRAKRRAPFKISLSQTEESSLNKDTEPQIFKDVRPGACTIKLFATKISGFL